MFHNYPLMNWLRLALFLSVASCTKPNPRSCADGICNDQSFPFCDVDGTLGGEPKECIAVACTASQFEACRGDKELRCNETGNNYDSTQCELGCSEALDGCRLCQPNETRCTNGKVATCGAAGEVIASEACAFGCFDDQPRCRRIDPSNNLGQYLDMAMFLADVDIENAVFEVDTGAVRVGAQSISVPSYLVPATGNGVRIRAFVAKSFKLKNAMILATGDPRDAPVAGIALLSHGDIHISGTVTVQSRAGGATADCAPGAGTSMENGDGNGAASGGGGGGNATEGAEGGEVTGRHARGAKDLSSGTAEIVPLRGGCAGGFQGNVGPGTYHTGGGALQLSSNTSVTIDGTIDVRGRAGESDVVGISGTLMNGGGGAGGSILIEGATVSLGSNAKLLASGGKGGAACTTASTYCGIGGEGATTTAPATVGGSVPFTTASNTAISAGGGGGGLGRVRINTRSSEYAKSSSAVEAASVSTGIVRTR